MKAVILGAGYATRLYPLTENKAKPLLEIGGRPLIEHVIDKINEIDVDEIIIVSNHKFINDFKKWREGYGSKINIKIIDDGSVSNEERLGAIKGLLFAIEDQDINDDLLVVAGDNILEFSFKDLYDNFKKIDKILIPVYDIGDIEKVRKKHGVVILDENNKVIDFQEKPDNPKSTLKSICCYLFKPGIKELLRGYLVENGGDATGFFIKWLIGKQDVYGFRFKENVYDIGNMESYSEACKIFS